MLYVVKLLLTARISTVTVAVDAENLFTRKVHTSPPGHPSL